MAIHKNRSCTYTRMEWKILELAEHTYTVQVVPVLILSYSRCARGAMSSVRLSWGS